MKILQLGKFYPVKGGVEKVAYDLMTGLSAQGIRCDMMCATVSGTGRTRSINPYAHLFTCHTWFECAATMIAPTMLTKLRKECAAYDILHIHHPDPMACLALLLSGYKGKVIVHWHSDIQKQKQLLKLYKPMQDWLLKRADLVIGTSPVYLSQSPFLQAVRGKAVCLPIGVDAMEPRPEFAEVIREKYRRRKIVFTLGRLVAYKGYNHLVEAACYLDDSYVVLIGGTGALQGALQAQIEQGALQDKVKLLGRIPDNDLPSYYGACSVFCLSSVMKTEAFGIVQVEAMSCGKPVVATRIPQSGVSWVNAHGVSGLNVEPGNARALAEAIKEITCDEHTYQAYSEGARKRYEELFTKREMIRKCLELYEGVLNNE